MKKQTNKARVKKIQLEALCDFIETINYKIEQNIKRREELQERIELDPDSVYEWDKEWLENGASDDEYIAYENLLKDIEKLI